MISCNAHRNFELSNKVIMANNQSASQSAGTQPNSQPTPIQPPTVEQVKELGNVLAGKREALKAIKAEYRDKLLAANEEVVEAQEVFHTTYQSYLLAAAADRGNAVIQLKQENALLQQKLAQVSPGAVPATQAPVSTPLATIPEEEPIAVQSAQTIRIAQSRADNLSVAPSVNLAQ